MKIAAALERQAVAVLFLWLRGTLAGALALPGFVAARLVLAGEHEILFARDAPTP